MSRVISQSLFTENKAEPRSWQSYAGSGATHVLLIGALFYVTFPAVRDIVTPPEHVTLVAPVIPEFKPKVIPQPVVHQRVILKEPVKPILPPKRFIPPPVIKPPVAKPVQVVKAPEIKAPTVQHTPEVKVEAPAPPKPPVTTGVFDSHDLAKGPKVPNQLKVGGFGDPNGAHPSDNSQAGKLTMAKLGSFDMPEGGGHGGGGGKSQNGGIKASGFGSFGDPAGVPGGTGTHGSVRTAGFGDSTAAPRQTQIAQAQAAPATTPVEVLFKPKPNYSDEARKLGLEGQVVVEVVFAADGTIHVVRVVSGLGHGLDEAAEQAARLVRFKPMTRNGAPVDARGSLTITFQST